MFFGYFKSGPFGSDSGNGGGRIEPPSTRRKEGLNFFAKETVIDPALTSALQAPVKVNIPHLGRRSLNVVENFVTMIAQYFVLFKARSILEHERTCISAYFSSLKHEG